MRMTIKGMQATVVVLSWLICQGGAAAEGTCSIYDGTLYTNKPASRPGMLDIQVAYESDLWDPAYKDAPMPVQSRVESVARAAEARSVPLVLDIERWKVDNTVSDADVVVRIDKLVEVVRWAREAAPNLRLGYFSLAPMAAMSWAAAPEGSADNLEWRRVNDRLRRLADAVDMIFPYVYTYKYNPDEWQTQAIGNIVEARRYGKPVYVFLWFQYSERNQELGYTFVPSEFWLRQLDTGCRHADGIVIWGGWDPKNNRRAVWDGTLQWWLDVQAFQGVNGS